MTDAIELVNRAQDFLDRVRRPPTVARRQTEFLKQREHLRVKIEIHSFDRAGAVENNAERTFRHDRRIKLLERAGCGVARVGKDRQARFRALDV